MQSLELTLDPAADERVLGQWGALRDAGLPSQARHTGATNRPHVTLAVRDGVTEEGEAGLGAVAARLPLDVRVGTVLLFRARRRWVLARHVVLDRALLDLHEHAHTVLGGGGSPLTAPGSWVPHLTLARGVRDEQLPEALGLVADAPPFTAAALRLRRWDQEAARAWDVVADGPDQASAGRSL